MAAISAATQGKAPINSPKPMGRAHPSLPKGTVGSVRAGLGGIQEIQTDLILSWGPQDRLELTTVNTPNDPEDVHDIVQSIQQHGQHVPVLLRPAAEKDGKFEVIYGRRRVLACQTLGIPVKALIRSMDNGEALKAKGLENSHRQDLSFYERARFAQAILAQGYSRAEVLSALSVSKNTLSQLERVVRLIPDAVGVRIGPAHGAGRPKWMALALAFENGSISAKTAMLALDGVSEGTGSDDRLKTVLDKISKRGAPENRAIERSPLTGAVVKSTKSSISLTVKRAGETKRYADWLEQNIDQLIEDSYRSFQEEAGV
ncbi:MAG: plasmid partitioning protein RepB [Paracoccaceae bacterium]